MATMSTRPAGRRVLAEPVAYLPSLGLVYLVHVGVHASGGCKGVFDEL